MLLPALNGSTTIKLSSGKSKKYLLLFFNISFILVLFRYLFFINIIIYYILYINNRFVMHEKYILDNISILLLFCINI